VLGFAEAGAGGTIDRSRGQIVRVSLSSLLSREEILAEARKKTGPGALSDAVQALVKEIS
jgi:hypothetical protein